MNEEELCQRINIPLEIFKDWKSTNPELVKLVSYGLEYEKDLIIHLKMRLNSIDTETIIEIEEYFGNKMTQEQKERLKEKDEHLRKELLQELELLS